MNKRLNNLKNLKTVNLAHNNIHTHLNINFSSNVHIEYLDLTDNEFSQHGKINEYAEYFETWVDSVCIRRFSLTFKKK